MSELHVIRAAHPKTGETGMDYFAGIVAETVASEKLSLQIVRIPPGVRSAAHSHGEHETAAYVLEGEIVTWFGDELIKHATARKGDFLFIPAGIPHVAANYGDVEAVAVLARSDPAAQETVKPYPKLDALAHLAKPPGLLAPPRAPRHPF